MTEKIIAGGRDTNSYQGSKCQSEAPVVSGEFNVSIDPIPVFHFPTTTCRQQEMRVRMCFKNHQQQNPLKILKQPSCGVLMVTWSLL